MKKQVVLLLAVLLFSLNINGQMNFTNNDPEGSFPKIEINNTSTTLFAKIGENSKPWLHWNEVPKNIETGNGRSKFKMTVFNNDGIANRTFEILYTISYGQSNTDPTAYIKATYIYRDKRPNKILEEHFKLIQ
ncbi:hypothetical protein KCTC52924_02642 [Arenibacter antarcticus]|uniref:Uncharacterized protein n=1 Tax=Arenibacter antarcticus TaxID=2040469 RepID=A0ABW5VLQ4_9FLAO|nr:hypothetical protein [Arenibacter sp. H213]MCM4168941.1 hypothetical protein [Arenibacter sp. H213]